jgi:hypothetical protein
VLLALAPHRTYRAQLKILTAELRYGPEEWNNTSATRARTRVKM